MASYMKSIKNAKEEDAEKCNRVDGEKTKKDNDTSVKYTKKIRRYPKKNLEIPKLSDRAEKRRAIEQSDSDDETPEERNRRIHTEYKHRYRLRLDAEMMFDLEIHDRTDTPSKQPRITEARDSV